MKMPKATRDKIDAIVLSLQEDAESENYHSMMSVYQDIADIVMKHARRPRSKSWKM